MTKELQLNHTASGAVLYAIVLNGAGQAWNGTAFESVVTANWATYAVTMTEAGTTRLYQGDMPTGIVTAGRYSVLFRVRGGGSAAVSDTLAGTGSIEWDGSAEAVIPTTTPPTADDLVEAMTTAGFAKVADVNVEIVEPGQS